MREDGSQYFHQEFSQNVQTYASNHKSKTDLAEAVPQSLRPNDEFKPELDELSGQAAPETEYSPVAGTVMN